MPSLRLESTAPDFEAQTTRGLIRFHEFIGDSWASVFTPVCTTEFGEVARRPSEFANRNVKIIGISVNSLEDHYKWIQDINDYGSKVGPIDVQFPIVNTCPFDPFSALVTSLGIRTQIADEDRKTSTLYDISQRQRSSFYVFVIDKEGHSSYNLLSCVNRQAYR
ncbi:hypothetical protein SCLCIDRAFT_30171 [Scleroderma citrinum Foug A]|uniref:Thioredoxin domain-containing protein n=1 Tax=Scleroderma citrinum Foug A TaxID=1036808 RepID=A0A0C3DI23_9AGAM|nr:hypothetical protein SCLCIDRAFT_30171 [Scleroderma citrinum Foug A]